MLNYIFLYRHEYFRTQQFGAVFGNVVPDWGAIFAPTSKGRSCQLPGFSYYCINFMEFRFGLGGNFNSNCGQEDPSNTFNIKIIVLENPSNGKDTFNQL
ncbi:hypothetical protein KFK09_006634 [Dendrobium nobile]|uniref:Uncharacterized protein n=1 Tax=Dendrobium nobile TaxID=94219 RepID=A0A8T3BPS9_DENNO|nr:hypothetical protein KFK09_006634 [Dendrobium nobile]